MKEITLRTKKCVFCKKPIRKGIDCVGGHVTARIHTIEGGKETSTILASWHNVCGKDRIPLGGFVGEWEPEMGVKLYNSYESPNG